MKTGGRSIVKLALECLLTAIFSLTLGSTAYFFANSAGVAYLMILNTILFYVAIDTAVQKPRDYQFTLIIVLSMFAGGLLSIYPKL